MDDIRDFSLADPRANQVLQKLRAELAVATAFRYLGRPVQVSFPLANTQTEVPHQLTEIPDGMQVLTADCNLTREPGKQWTKELAYLRSDRANSFAVVAFGVFREEAFLVQAAV